MNQIDQQILDLIQSRFPVVPQPFEEMGRLFETTADEIIRHLCRLKSLQVIRKIAASFDTGRLGHASALIAMQVAPERLEEVGAKVSECPQVTHNYSRDHPCNLWFTLVAENEDQVREIATRISRETEVGTYHILPARRLFKIRVEFQFQENCSSTSPVTPGRAPVLAMNTRPSAALVHLLQTDLPLVPRPFLQLARQVGMTEEEILTRIDQWKQTGLIRRYGAVLRHHQAGFEHNVMAVWRVPEMHVEEAGKRIAEFKEVSHCYERPPFDGFPFNVYSMIHGRSRGECESVVGRISETIGISDFQLLYTMKEFKKTSPRYFAGEREPSS